MSKKHKADLQFQLANARRWLKYAKRMTQDADQLAALKAASPSKRNIAEVIALVRRTLKSESPSAETRPPDKVK